MPVFTLSVESKLTIEKTRGIGGIIVTVAVFLVFLGSVIFGTIQLERNNFLEADLRKEKLHAEILLSEKLFLEKELLRLEPLLKTMKTEGTDKDRQLTDAAHVLSVQQREAMQRQLIAHAMMDSLKKDNRQLEASQEDLAETVSFLVEENKKLREALKQQRAAAVNWFKVYK